MISKEKEVEICRKAVNTFGEYMQMIKAIEEMSELMHALCRIILDQEPDIDNMEEEIADVEILICQLKQMNIATQETINLWKEKKLKKLEGVVW